MLIGVCLCFPWGGCHDLAPFGFVMLIVGIVMFMTKQKEINDKHTQEVKEHLGKCISTHFDTLLIKYNQTVYQDDYRRYILDDWYKEIQYFINNIVFPNEKYEYFEDAILKMRIQMFLSCWDELLKEHLEKTKEQRTINKVVKNGIDYEIYVEKYLQIAGYNVTRTPKTGDQGVDLIAEKDDDRKAIQCKYYSKPVGNKAVQEVIAGANFYQCTSAAVVSNASFTKSARQLAENSNIELVNLIPE